VLELLLQAHHERSGRVIEGAGHWVQYERASKTNHALLSFLHDANGYE
jgi:pimeloyl-ACP methyl ester carboxylesterase